MATVTYYWDSYDSGTSDTNPPGPGGWFNPARAVNGLTGGGANLSSSGSTSVATYDLVLDETTAPGTNLGNITQVESRYFCGGDNDDYPNEMIDMTVVSSGLSQTFTPPDAGALGAWSSWYTHSGTFNWSQFPTLILTVTSNHVEIKPPSGYYGTLDLHKAELRITYDPVTAVEPATEALTLTSHAPATYLPVPPEDSWSNSYGSITYGSGYGIPRLTFEPSTEQALTLTVQAPTIFIFKSVEPDTEELDLTLHAPVLIIDDTVILPTQPATLTLHTPNINYSGTTFPGTQGLGLTLEDATDAVTFDVNFATTLTLHDSVREVTEIRATLPIALTVHAPVTMINQTVMARLLTMGVYAGFAPTIGSLQPTITRFIYDPVVTDGCAQCGTLLWDKAGTPIHIHSRAVHSGRNIDLDSDAPDDRYIRCGRCGWINNQNRHNSHPIDSRSGWGLRYDEEATS